MRDSSASVTISREITSDPAYLIRSRISTGPSIPVRVWQVCQCTRPSVAPVGDIEWPSSNNSPEWLRGLYGYQCLAVSIAARCADSSTAASRSCWKRALVGRSVASSVVRRVNSLCPARISVRRGSVSGVVEAELTRLCQLAGTTGNLDAVRTQAWSLKFFCHIGVVR